MILEEKTISSDRVYTGKVVSLRVETVETLNQGYQKREIVEHCGSVGIVAINNGKIVLVKQFRKPIEKMIWEIPSGRLCNGENPKECAIRELKQETGYTAENIKLIKKFYTSPGFLNQIMYLYLAEGLTPGECEFGAGEYLDVHEIEINEASEMIAKGEIDDAKTIISILLSKELI